MKRHWSFQTWAAAAVLVLSARQALPADSWPADAPLVADKVRQLMQDRNYAEAVKAIDEAAAAKDAPKDYLAYLKGRALSLQNQYDEAVAVFDAMQKDFPKSPWLRRARFAKAVALARKGDFRAAELIVRAEAEYLLSADRKQQIADIYLEFADALFKPPKDDQTARLRQGAGVLPEGVGGRAEAGEADRGRVAGGPVPAEPGASRPRRPRSTRSSSRTHPPSSPLGRSRPASAWASAGWPRAT